MQRTGEMHRRVWGDSFELAWIRCPVEEGCSQVLRERKGIWGPFCHWQGIYQIPQNKRRWDGAECFSRRKGAKPNSEAKR